MKATLMQGLKSGDRTLAESAFAVGFRGRIPGPADGTAVPAGSLEIRSWAPQGLPELDAAAFLERLFAHREGWTRVERASWRPFECRARKDLLEAAFRVHFQVAGVRADGGRVDLQTSLKGRCEKQEGIWRLTRLELEDGHRAASAAPPWADITDAAGFRWNESEESRRVFQESIDLRGPSTNGGLAVVDWNRDDRPDLLATFAEKFCVLFLNDGAGGFTRQDLPFASRRECPWMLLYADLDEDGLEEIVTGKVLGYEGNVARAGIYTRRDGNWTLLHDALKWTVGPEVRAVVCQALAIADVNGDGLLDVYVGNYNTSQSSELDFNKVAAYDGADSALFINRGGLEFSEESDSRGIVSTQYVYAAAFFDLDEDGDPDLIQCNDWGPNVYWENQGDGTFLASRNHVLARGSSYSMGISIADYDNSGRWALHVSNMYSHAGNRVVSISEFLGPEMRATAYGIAAGNWMYERDPKTAAWEETSRARGVNIADWAWGCLFVDLDNDADRDLAVTNGYTSHQDPAAPDF
jgi:hypothetical protein